MRRATIRQCSRYHFPIAPSHICVVNGMVDLQLTDESMFVHGGGRLHQWSNWPESLSGSRMMIHSWTTRPTESCVGRELSRIRSTFQNASAFGTLNIHYIQPSVPDIKDAMMGRYRRLESDLCCQICVSPSHAKILTGSRDTVEPQLLE